MNGERDVIDKSILKEGAAEEIRQIAESISCCGLVCRLCHLAEQCEGCRSVLSICGCRTLPEGCYQYNCCQEKGIEGCYQCEEAPCDKGMFGKEHDLRLRAFIRYIKEHGKDRLAYCLYQNARIGIFYGHGRDYDNLPDEEAVLKKLEAFQE